MKLKNLLLNSNQMRQGVQFQSLMKEEIIVPILVQQHSQENRTREPLKGKNGLHLMSETKMENLI
jgi:hypothetical protein